MAFERGARLDNDLGILIQYLIFFEQNQKYKLGLKARGCFY